MSNFNDPYTIISLVSAITILIMGVCLLGFAVPKDVRLSNYRLSRRLLAFAYFVLAVVGIWEIFDKPSPDDAMVLFVFTLIAASFQAFFFTFSLITLINIYYITFRKIACNVALIVLVSTVLLLYLNHTNVLIQSVIIYFSVFCYCCQMIYYTVLFVREYKEYANKMDNIFSENEQKRLNWIKTAFCMALGIGIFASISLFVPLAVYIAFTVIYTLFYVYYVLKYVNYVNIFYYVIPALEYPTSLEIIDDAGKTGLLAREDFYATKCLDQAINSWIERKGFITPGITLDILAQEFMTNRTYLSAYINQNKKQNFKTWIGELRIEEAKNLMQLHPQVSLSKIGEMVGIFERVSFYRQFLKVTGKAPNDFRLGNN